jgi:hypothetical protein
MENPNNIFDQVQKRKITVPERAYFDAMADSILSQQASKIVPLYKKPLVWISSAAAAAIIAITIQLSTSTEESLSLQAALNEIPHETILAYVTENIDDYEIDEIAEIIPEGNIQEIEVFQPATIESTTNLSFDNISNEEIMDYLFEEGIDLEEMNESELFFI